MTDQELIKRLRHGEGWPITAADRIEELVKERDDYKDLYYAGFKDAASLNIYYAEVGYKAKTAEAKLAKAVKTLQILKPLLGDSWVDRRVLAVLAELEGRE